MCYSFHEMETLANLRADQSEGQIIEGSLTRSSPTEDITMNFRLFSVDFVNRFLTKMRPFPFRFSIAHRLITTGQHILPNKMEFVHTNYEQKGTQI